MDAKKVFVLGLPGSGKTAAASFISMIARDKGRPAQLFNDYTILRKWFEAAPDGPEFSRTVRGGFDVHDYSVFDTSLQELERQVLKEKPDSDEALVTIEFARNDYFHALQQFSASFLQDSYFLFIDAENSVCQERTYKRSVNSSLDDDHYVSGYIFEAYYKEGRDYTIASINTVNDRDGKKYTVNMQNIAVISNLGTSSLETFHSVIEQHTILILDGKNIASVTTEVPLQKDELIKERTTDIPTPIENKAA